jgi:hypothetical protein
MKKIIYLKGYFMKKLQISLCALLALGCISQSAQANLMQDQLSQLSVQAVALRDQATTYVQAYPKAFMGAAAGITAASLYFRSKAHQPERGIKLADNYKGNLLRKDIIDEKLQNGYHKDCLKRFDYRKLIEDGAHVFNERKNNPNQYIQYTKLIEVIELSWFLYSLTMYKNQDVTRGMMVVEDNDGTIYNFLKNYVDTKNPDAEYSFFKKISFNRYAYERYSTHFPKSKTRQYGIDIRDESGNRFAVLPGGQTHILFGKADNGHTFIKFERDGLYALDGWFQHALTATTAVGRKVPVFGGFFGSNDYESSSKEHVPSDIKKEAAKLGRNEKTISALANACAKNQRKYKSLIEKINQRYPFLADEKKRFGNEAIITERDLTLSEYYKEHRSEAELEQIRSIIDEYQQTLNQRNQQAQD